MLTDWLLTRRMAREVDELLRGSRVRDVGALADGRIGLALWRSGRTRLLCIDAFGSPPLLTLEDHELPIAAEPGFVRTLGAALRGMVLHGVASAENERRRARGGEEYRRA